MKNVAAGLRVATAALCRDWRLFLLQLAGSGGLWLGLAVLAALLPVWLLLGVATLASSVLGWNIQHKLAARNAETRRLGAELAARLDEVAARVNDKRRSEEKFARVFHACPVTIVISRLESDRILDVNPAFEQQFGWSHAEAVGATPMDLGLWPDTASYQRWRDGLGATERLDEYETGLRSKQGDLRQVRLAAEVFQYDEARFVIAMVHDITELRRALQEVNTLNAVLEDRVRQRTADLTEANRELESFAYSVSHDLRAPLRGIDGFSHLLVDEYGDRIEAQGRDYLARVRQAAQRMGALIDDLLDLSRFNRRELRHETVDLSRMAREVAEELRCSDPARSARIDVAAGLCAEGDADLLRVVLENLIGNAWKYTARKDHTLIAVGRSGGDPGESVFFVRDNGVGFDMAYAGKLFQPFQRLHPSDEFAGSGVGLASVARAVRRHRGRVWARSQPGAGAVFCFTLPER